MANWVQVGAVADLTAEAKACLSVEGVPLIVCSVDGEVTVIANVCPHAGLPLGEGELRGKVITCPFHGYAYDVTTGRNIDFPHDEPPVRVYDTKIDDGQMWVDLPAKT